MIGAAIVLLAVWVGASPVAGIAIGYGIRHGCRTRDGVTPPGGGVDAMPIDLATMAPVDLINIKPGRYVTTRPVTVMAGNGQIANVGVEHLLTVS